MSTSDILFELEFIYEGAEEEPDRGFDELLSLLEFKGDLKKQCVVLMGLPAAGKTTWIKTEGSKYIPGFRGYKTVNSDVQLKRTQYDFAKEHYASLVKLDSREAYEKEVKSLQYVDNDGKKITWKLSWEEFVQIKEGGGFREFFKVQYPAYYANWFDIRDIAKRYDARLFDDKVVQAGHILVIDTVAAKSGKILRRLKKTKDQGFQNTIVYLEIRPDLCIVRDKYRKEHRPVSEGGGRGVGEKVIMDYHSNMSSAFQAYMADGGNENGVVDRVLHFVFKHTGPLPIHGVWRKISDDRFDVRRDITKRVLAKGPPVR